MEFRIPSVEEMVVMSPAEVERGAQELEVIRRQVVAASAMRALRVDQTSAHLADGHKSLAAWGRATNNWSPTETLQFTKLARAFKWLPHFAEAALTGAIGVDFMHAVAKLASNPRVRQHLADADQRFATAAVELTFEEFSVLLRHWEELADTDGARQRHDRAMHERHASVNFVGERVYLDAAGPSYDGVVISEVLDHYTDLEWQNEWDMLKAIHGDDMRPELMVRTHAQRRFDALLRIIHQAADRPNADGDGPAVTVEIAIDQATYEHQLEEMLGGNPEPIPPSHAPDRKCHDRRRRVVDPRAAVAASVVGQVRRKVLGADSVVLDMGRRQRLFTGPLREAVLSSAAYCTYIGCRIHGHHCQADHLIPFARGGLTNARNGGPGCNHHNPWKNNGTLTVRDAKGLWHTYRPDGTEIGWPNIRLRIDHPHVAPYVVDLVALAYTA
jgi:hypothetical protein